MTNENQTQATETTIAKKVAADVCQEARGLQSKLGVSVESQAALPANFNRLRSLDKINAILDEMIKLRDEAKVALANLPMRLRLEQMASEAETAAARKRCEQAYKRLQDAQRTLGERVSPSKSFKNLLLEQLLLQEEEINFDTAVRREEISSRKAAEDKRKTDAEALKALEERVKSQAEIAAKRDKLEAEARVKAAADEAERKAKEAKAQAEAELAERKAAKAAKEEAVKHEFLVRRYTNLRDQAERAFQWEKRRTEGQEEIFSYDHHRYFHRWPEEVRSANLARLVTLLEAELKPEEHKAEARREEFEKNSKLREQYLKLQRSGRCPPPFETWAQEREERGLHATG